MTMTIARDERTLGISTICRVRDTGVVRARISYLRDRREYFHFAPGDVIVALFVLRPDDEMQKKIVASIAPQAEAMSGVLPGVSIMSGLANRSEVLRFVGSERRALSVYRSHPAEVILIDMIEADVLVLPLLLVT